MKKNTLDYINEIYTGGYKNALSYVNSVSPVIVEEESDSGPDYLCFTSTGESTIGLYNDSGNTPVLFYSTDKKNWVSWDYSTITLNDGESVYFYGENPDGFSKDFSGYSRFTMTGSIAASGNIQTLLSQNGDREDVTETCYYNLFYNCTLTTAPKLPATTLANYCYFGMFNDCSSLTSAPELPATTLANSCYGQMFSYCSSLTEAPALPATTLDTSCYYYMFANCSSLAAAPKLPATTLANSCYGDMFLSCTSLTVAPALPATTLANSCYSNMFSGCTALTEGPVLPATTLATECYLNMFGNCSALTTAPATLPATTLADSCYQSMFTGCTALTAAPELPATTLGYRCYQSMFYGCSALTEAPVLPATRISSYSYAEMFYGCSALASVTTYITNWNGMMTMDWLADAGTNATNPTIYCPSDSTLKTLPKNNSNIPEGWTQVDL